MGNFAALLAAADGAALSLLGEDVLYTPAVGSPLTVQGIFDAAYIRVDSAHAGVSSSGPAVCLQLSDLAEDPSTVATLPGITIRSVAYTVHEAKPDGAGLVVLLLHKVT